jgi:hypothetical protein
MALAVGGLSCAGLLVTAGKLQPDPSGVGTHQQLGLPPCTIQVWFQVRCPACGMTTAWSHFVRGQWLSAVAANAGGTLLALLSTAAAVWLLGSAARGRWLWTQPSDQSVFVLGLSIVGVTLADWLIRMVPVLAQ